MIDIVGMPEDGVGMVLVSSGLLERLSVNAVMKVECEGILC